MFAACRLHVDVSSWTRIDDSECQILGADRRFSFSGEGGGGRKRLCARTHITSEEPNSLSAGVQGPLKGPGSSVLTLSRAI